MSHSVPRDWSDAGLLQLMDAIVAALPLHPLVRSRVDQDDLKADIMVRLIRHVGELTGKPRPVWEDYLRQTIASTRSDLHRHHLDAEKRDAGRDVPEARLAEGPLRDSTPDLGGLLSAGITSPSSAAARSESYDRLHAAITTLPPDQRQATLLELEGCSRPEIAAKMGRTEEAVTALLFRARSKLGRVLNPFGR